MKYYFKKSYFLLPLVFTLLVGLVIGLFFLQRKTFRTSKAVAKNERALWWSAPEDGDYTNIGLYAGRVGSSNHDKLSPQTIKAPHSLFHHLHAEDDSIHGGHFPYSKLKDYEAKEIAAGRPPIFVTATYQGKKRPVTFRSPSPAETTRYAVNLFDDRYIKFYVEEYIKKVIYPGKETLDETEWLACDNGMFMYSNYGVFDDNGKFISSVKWDEPFAQNNDEFLDSIAYFFRRLKERYPDVKILVNSGSVDMNRFEDVYENIPGISYERTINFVDNTYVRNYVYDHLIILDWFAQKNKFSLIGAYQVDHQDPVSIRTHYIGYLIAKGNNSFFGAHRKDRLNGSYVDVSPTRYQQIRDALGETVGRFQSQHETGSSGKGYRLYWRVMEKGIAYLNMTGKTKTVTLPTDRDYYDRNGNKVTSITVSDMKGDYVTSRQIIPPAPKSLIGDFDDDDDLDITDIALILSVYTQLSVPVNSSNQKFDVDNNNRIDIADIAIVLSYYTQLVVR